MTAGERDGTVLVTPESLRSEEAEIAGDLYRHLFRARRQRVDDRLRLVDGRGGCRWATVTEIGRERAVLRLDEPATPLEPEREARVLAPTFRPERASWLVEKTTELGVRGISFFHCARAPRSFGEGQLQRFERVAVAALQQSGGAVLPEIEGVLRWEQCLERVAGGAAVLLDPAGDRQPALSPGDPVTLLVGPEGGFTEDELAAVRAAGARPLALGARILRVETAAVVGLSQLLCRASDGAGSR